jgi:hypothetical protein
MLIFSKAAKAILAFRSFSICFLVSRLLSFISFLGNTRLMEEKEHITSSFIIKTAFGGDFLLLSPCHLPSSLKRVIDLTLGEKNMACMQIDSFISFLYPVRYGLTSR